MAVSKRFSRLVAGLSLTAVALLTVLPATANAEVNGDKFGKPLQLSPLGELVQIILKKK